MANTISILSLANTFSEWVNVTNREAIELNSIGKGNYRKDSGTLFLDNAGLGLQSNSDVIITKKLEVSGVNSFVTVQKNLTVTGGQVYFQNNVLGLTNSGMANIGGVLNALAPNTGLYVANTANISGRINVTGAATLSNTLYVSANTTLNSYLSVTQDAFANNIFVTNTTNTRNIIYSGTLTGGTGVISIGPNQINKEVGGNVGIGTAATGFRVSIAGAAPSSIPLYLSSDASNAYVYTPNSLFVGTTTAYPISFVTNNIEKARLDANGRLGIATQSPAANLHVIGDSIVSGNGTFNRIGSILSVNTATLTVTGNTTTNILQANTSVNTALVTTTTLNVRNLTANNLSSNSLGVAGNTITNNITSNNLVSAVTVNVSGNTTTNIVIANTITTNTISATDLTVSGLTILSGALQITGTVTQDQPTLSTSNTTTLNDSSPVLRSATFNIYRPGSTANATLRWNESAKYWDFIDVANTSNPFYKILTTNNVSGLTRAISISDGGTGSRTFTTGNVISYNGSTLVSLPVQTFTSANLGSSNTITSIVFDSYGRVITANALPIRITTSQVTGLDLTSAGINTTNATNITTGTLNAARLPASGVVGGTYGNTTQIPILTIDSTGRVNTATTTSISTAITLQADGTTGTVSGGGTLTVKGSTGIGVSIPFNDSVSTFDITNTGVTSLAGTLNQVSVSRSSGSVTLSLPQAISSNSSPSFVKVTANLDAKIANSVSFSGQTYGGLGNGAAVFTGSLNGNASSSTDSANTGSVMGLPLQPNNQQIIGNQVARTDTNGNMRLGTILYGTSDNQVVNAINVQQIIVTQSTPGVPDNILRKTSIGTLTEAIRTNVQPNSPWNISVLGEAGSVAAANLTGSTLSSTVTGSSLTSVGTITSGTWSSGFGAVSGANLTNLSAGNLVGTVPNTVISDTVSYTVGSLRANTTITCNTLSSNTIVVGPANNNIIPWVKGSGFTANSALWVKGDITADRGDGSGVVFLGKNLGYIYNNGSDYMLGTVATKTNNLNVPGTVVSHGLRSSDRIVIRNGSPTIYLQDTDSRSGMIHCNSNLVYILRGTGNDSTEWGKYNDQWPFYISLNNNDAVFGGSVSAASDIRGKENISTIDNALDKTVKLRGVYYTKVDDKEKIRKVGVIAQETREVLPEVIHESADENKMLSVDYGNIVGLLIEAIKELKQEVDEFKGMLSTK